MVHFSLKREYGSVLREGFIVGVKLEVIYSLIMMTVIFVFAEEIMTLFLGSGESQVVEAGLQYLKIMAFFYCLD